MTLRALAQFAGAAAPLLGVWLGWQHVAAVEKDPYCRAILAARFPGMPVHQYAGKAPYATYRGRIDILTAGWPCQPHSYAGKRLGARDKRDGWRHVVRALRYARPGLAFLENVPGVLSSAGGRYFGGCLADLDALGYDAEWVVLGADQAGAPHRRDRLFILAHASRNRRSERSESNRGSIGSGQQTPQRDDADGCGPAVADASRGDRGQRGDVGGIPQGERSDHRAARRGSVMANAHGERLRAEQGREQTRQSDPGRRNDRVADADGSGSEEPGRVRKRTADAVLGCSGRPRRAEPALGRSSHGLADWMDWPAARGDWPATPGEAPREWEAPRTCESTPGRPEAIRALGNGWVIPQVVLAWHLLSARISNPTAAATAARA